MIGRVLTTSGTCSTSLRPGLRLFRLPQPAAHTFMDRELGQAGACRDPEQYLRGLRASTGPLVLPIAESQTHQLHLFQVTGVQLSADQQYLQDAVFFVGGPVWALDWSPEAEAVAVDAPRHLAVRSSPRATVHAELE